MIFVVLVMPMALLGALFAMNRVEQWVDGEPPERAARPDARTSLPEPRRASSPYDPKIMGNREAVGQSS